MLVVTDVLEHIEPEYLDNVLTDLRRLMKKICYVVIRLGPSSKNLPDGRNCHVNQQSKDWWINKLGQYFEVGAPVEADPELHLILGPSQKHQSLPVAQRVPG
jgi:hypothetical protein